MEIKFDKVCCVEIRRGIDWTRYNEEEITISQERRLKEFTNHEPIVMFVDSDTAEEIVQKYMNDLKDSCDKDIRYLVRLSLSVPFPGHSHEKSTLSNIGTYNEKYYNLSEVD